MESLSNLSMKRVKHQKRFLGLPLVGRGPGPGATGTARRTDLEVGRVPGAHECGGLPEEVGLQDEAAHAVGVGGDEGRQQVQHVGERADELRSRARGNGAMERAGGKGSHHPHRAEPSSPAPGRRCTHDSTSPATQWTTKKGGDMPAADHGLTPTLGKASLFQFCVSKQTRVGTSILSMDRAGSPGPVSGGEGSARRGAPRHSACRRRTPAGSRLAPRSVEPHIAHGGKGRIVCTAAPTQTCAGNPCRLGWSVKHMEQRKTPSSDQTR